MTFRFTDRLQNRRLNSAIGNGPYDTSSFFVNTVPALPPESQALTAGNPRLLELTRQYVQFGNPPCSNWGSPERNLPYFRADNDYVWQPRYFEDRFFARLRRYAKYVESVDTLQILNRTTEDLLFGAFGLRHRGRIVSRDLLDSVIQINWAYGAIRELRKANPIILDIGAGYGRLAHRVSEAFDGSWCVSCADGVALSTFISEWYLNFREARNVNVIPVPELSSKLQTQRPDVAFNIHSFSEIPISSTLWWVNELEVAGVENLIVVTNERTDDFLSSEVDGRRIDLFPVFKTRGWVVARQEPIVTDSDVRRETNVLNSFLHFVRR